MFKGLKCFIESQFIDWEAYNKAKFPNSNERLGTSSWRNRKSSLILIWPTKTTIIISCLTRACRFCYIIRQIISRSVYYINEFAKINRSSFTKLIIKPIIFLASQLINQNNIIKRSKGNKTTERHCHFRHFRQKRQKRKVHQSLE